MEIEIKELEDKKLRCLLFANQQYENIRTPHYHNDEDLKMQKDAINEGYEKAVQLIKEKFSSSPSLLKQGEGK